MATSPHDTDRSKSSDFADMAAKPQSSMLSDLFHFIRHTRWWLTPIILAMLLAGILVIFGSSAVAPFIYPLF